MRTRNLDDVSLTQQILASHPSSRLNIQAWRIVTVLSKQVMDLIGGSPENQFCERGNVTHGAWLSQPLKS